VVSRDVFICYSQPDRECADELVARFESENINCWIAPRDISPSADWAAEIIDAISAARVMVLVFSAKSNDSPQVRREVERAVHKKVIILPFRIEDVLPSKSLEYFLSTQHWMDAFHPPREAHYENLCRHLKKVLEAHPIPAASDAALLPYPAAYIGAVLPVDLDASDLAQIERQLAGYLGPVARHLVRRAAARASGMEDMTLQLAAELDSEPDRRQFLDSCRSLTRPRA
jgi:hypothetical protein